MNQFNTCYRVAMGLLACFTASPLIPEDKNPPPPPRANRAGPISSSFAPMITAAAYDPRKNPISRADGKLKYGGYVAHRRDENAPLRNLFLRMLQEMGMEMEAFATSSSFLEWWNKRFPCDTAWKPYSMNLILRSHPADLLGRSMRPAMSESTIQKNPK